MKASSVRSHTGRNRFRRLGRWTGGAGSFLLLVPVGAFFWTWWAVNASLPPIEGERHVGGLESTVVIDRDDRGIPVLRGDSRRDLALATGFVHGQDRFFQMDLLRRRAAGELGELFGRRARDADASVRIHRLRETARRALAAEPPERRELVGAYASGVNAGLESLSGFPFEYLVLRSDPAPWRPEDTYLVVLAMFLQLQDERGEFERAHGFLHECLSPELYAFLTPPGTRWDSPIDGSRLEIPTAPPDDQPPVAEEPAEARRPIPDDPFVPGSNAWAVAGTRTVDGRALLANDMHLGLSLPVIWYRTALVWTSEEGVPERVDGLTLPGTPVIVSGSNGRVAWGFTNSQIDTSDVVVWEAEEADAEEYATPEGREPYQRFQEILRFKDGSEETLPVVWSRWGPVFEEEDRHGRRWAVRWVGHEPAAVNLGLLGLEAAESVDDALEVANRSGMPAQNLLIADRDGRIAWTIAGRLPRRAGFDGRRPGAWSNGSRRWDGWLDPAEYPRIVDPESGLLWSGNQRMVGGEMLAKLGDGGYVLGARAGQIRDRLHALREPDELDMLALQLDDEAIFLNRWRDLLLAALTPEVAGPSQPLRRSARQLVEGWEGHASIDSAGYRMIRRFRLTVAQDVFGHLTQACREIDPGFIYRTTFHRYEEPLWQILESQPLHLLSPEHDSWNDQLLAAVDGAIEHLLPAGGVLENQTWGRRNTLVIRHPMAGLPLVGRFLAMPERQVPGDNYMPRVQHPSVGASERLVVSPGREHEGFFHMPAGQSGHPFSPHFGDQQEAWVEGAPTPFMPGEATWTYTLRPR